MGPRAGVDGCGKSRPKGIRSPDRPARVIVNSSNVNHLCLAVLSPTYRTVEGIRMLYLRQMVSHHFVV